MRPGTRAMVSIAGSKMLAEVIQRVGHERASYRIAGLERGGDRWLQIEWSLGKGEKRLQNPLIERDLRKAAERCRNLRFVGDREGHPVVIGGHVRSRGGLRLCVETE